MKRTARAPANIAFIKYWGKKGEENLRIPSTDNVSMNLSGCFTVTTVDFSEKYKKDDFKLQGEETRQEEMEKVFKHLDRIRKVKGKKIFARVVSRNSFPKGSGIASSASGFAALTVACTAALGLQLTEKELTILARLGSGSAARSIPDGFVKWLTGKTSEESFAYTIFDEKYWDIRDIILVISNDTKKIGSTIGHSKSQSSIFYESRIRAVRSLNKQILKAFKYKDFRMLGEIIEKDCLYIHSIMMTSTPPIFYWEPKTIEIIRKIFTLREQGIEVYFTIDAGPNVHLIYEGETQERLLDKIKGIKGVKNIILNKVTYGTRLINNHLF